MDPRRNRRMKRLTRLRAVLTRTNRGQVHAHARQHWFDDARLSWENDELFWWHADDIDSLHLHGGFARAWARLHPAAPGARPDEPQAV